MTHDSFVHELYTLRAQQQRLQKAIAVLVKEWRDGREAVVSRHQERQLLAQIVDHQTKTTEALETLFNGRQDAQPAPPAQEVQNGKEQSGLTGAR